MGRFKRWLRRAALPFALVGAALAPATASAWSLEYGPHGGYLHWPIIANGQEHRYARAFITGWNDDSRWLITGTASGFPFAHAESKQSNSPKRTHWDPSRVNDCGTAYTNTCVVEQNDPNHLGCGIYTNNAYDGCTYINYVDTSDHFYYTYIELNWYNMNGPPGPFPLRTRQYRQHVYQHEVGHSFGLAHREANSCFVMSPTVYTFCPGGVASPIYLFDSYDAGGIAYPFHADGYTYGVASAPAGSKLKPYVLSKTVSTKHDMELAKPLVPKGWTLIRKDPTTPRVVTEFSNGVYKIVKGGRTYWLGNKNLDKAGRQWYVDQGVLVGLVHADAPAKS